MELKEPIYFEEGYALPIIEHIQFDSNERVGETNINKYGSVGTIVNYNNNKDIDILIDDGENKYLQYGNQYTAFKKGVMKSPFDKVVYGVGFKGVGPYSKTTHLKYYQKWHNMLQRCYDPKFILEYPTYEKCFVNEYFHNFQNFAYWCENNYYEVDGEFICLDKDILYQGNKEYSPTKCIFIPNRINVLFTNNKLNNKSGYSGVIRRGDKFLVQLHIDNKDKYIGSYDNIEEAIYNYKCMKELEIHKIAYEYKNKIPGFIFDILVNYKL